MKNLTHNGALNGSQIEDLANKFALDKTLAELLFNRGIDSEEKLFKYLNASASDLYNPFLLKCMQALVDRIQKAIFLGESVVVFGDYDVDGISASFVLWDYLKSIGAKVNYFVPCRLSDGYGLTFSTIDQVMERFNPSLIITVDCGISCIKEVEYASSLGVDVYVTDHHDIPEVIPEFSVDPKIEGQEYPFNKLCGAGVALKVVQALGGVEACKKYLPVVAIATVADIVSLTDENRAIVKLGLADYQSMPIGLKRLMEACGVRKPTARDIAYKLAPKINAPGRMGDSELAIKLYYEQDIEKINKTVDLILEHNQVRQEKCNQIYDDCINKLSDFDVLNTRAIVLKSDAWDKGLLGIAAARLSGEYNKPVLLFNEEDGVLKGSARSIEGINIVSLFESQKEYLENYGGHEMAGGLSLKSENYEQFKEKTLKYCENADFDKYFKVKKDYDLEIEISKINMDFAKQLELLEPTGLDNKAPLFRINFTRAFASQNKNYSNHFFVRINEQSFIAFSFLDCYNALVLPGKKWGIVEIAVDSYKGKQSVKNYLKHVELEGDANKLLLAQSKMEYLKHLVINDKNIDVLSSDKIKVISSSHLGHAVIVQSAGKVEEIKRQLGDNFDVKIGDANNLTAQNTIFVAPTSFDFAKNYHTLIFNFTPPMALDFNAKIYALSSQVFGCNELDVSREGVASVYVKYKNFLARKNSFVSELEFLNNFCIANPNNVYENLFAYHVFKELNFFKIKDLDGLFYIAIDENSKHNLTDSKLYQTVCKIKGDK